MRKFSILKARGAFLVMAAVLGTLLTQLVDADTPIIRITVDTSHPQARIEPEVYGQFIENTGSVVYGGIWVGKDSKIPNVEGYRKDVLDALNALKIPLLRWPGGCFADQYDWREGIGPPGKRASTMTAIYHERDDNQFGTHEFLNLAEMLGAEPYISINVGSLPPLVATRWLEYITDDGMSSMAQERRRNGRDKPWQLKYVGIGNELWGCGGMMNPEFAVDQVRRYSVFADTAYTRPYESKFYKIASGPFANNFDANRPFLKEYTDRFMRGAVNWMGGINFDALSLHYYAFPGEDPEGHIRMAPAKGFSERTWAEVLSAALRTEEYLHQVADIVEKYDPNHKVALALDEWGPWHGGGSDFIESTLLDAEVTALTLNVFHRSTERLKVANSSESINGLNSLILTDDERMVLTPAYHVFKMYDAFKGATPFHVTVDGGKYSSGGIELPMVDVTAARGVDGKMYLSIVNLDPRRAAAITTNLAGRLVGHLLTGGTLDARNTFDAQQEVSPQPFTAGDLGRGLVVTTPPKSIITGVVLDQ